MNTQVLPTLDQEIDARLYDLVNCRAEDQDHFTEAQYAEAYAYIEEHKAVIWDAYNAEMGDGEPVDGSVDTKDLFTFLVNTYLD